MKLLDILKAFENGEKIQKRLKKSLIWTSVEPNHLWNIADYEYRIKTDRTIYPYTKQELLEKIAEKGLWIVNDERNFFRIVDITDLYVIVKSSTDFQLTYDGLAEGFKWKKDDTPCGWDSEEYEAVDEPIFHQGVQWGTERVVRRKTK